MATNNWMSCPASNPVSGMAISMSGRDADALDLGAVWASGSGRC